MKLQNDRRGFLVKLENGYGEVAPMPTIGTETLAEAEQTLRSVREELHQINHLSIFELDHFLQPYNSTPSARYGIEQSFLDHFAQLKGISLAQILNPKVNRSGVSLNAMIPRISAQQAAQQTQDLINKGFKSIKIKVGSPNFQDDIDRLSAVRTIGGKDLSIHLDANGAWSLTAAIDHLSVLFNFGIEYIEQPVKTIGEMTELKLKSPIPIAIDEAVKDIDTLKTALELDCAHILVIKPLLWGGLLSPMEAIKLATKKSWEVVITSTLEGPIGRFGAYELARSCPEIQRPCGLTGCSNYNFEFI